MQATQSACLRVVVGAYKATPVYNLESEAWVPPIDLYLNRWAARAEQRLARTGMAQLLSRVCDAVASRLRRRRRRPRRNQAPRAPPEAPTIQRQKWAKEWLRSRLDREGAEEQRQSEEGAEAGRNREQGWVGIDADEITIAEWKVRRETQMRRADARRPGRTRHREAADLYTLDPPAQPLQTHDDLPKAKSSLLTQARTGAIGLRQFLFRRKVPDFPTPLCSCGEAPETVAHLAIRCREPDVTEGRPQVRDKHALMEMLRSKEGAARVVTWLMRTGRLSEYRLALELEMEQEAEEDGDGDREGGAPRGARRRRKRPRRVGL